MDTPVEQIAQAYWLLGWSWPEVEDLLVEQYEITERKAENAVEKAQEAVHALETKGPFVTPGQWAQLSTGSLVRVAAINKDEVDVEDPLFGSLTVRENQFSQDATESLAYAHHMRQAAMSLLGQKYDPPENEPIKVVPEEYPEGYQYKEITRAPKGLGDIVPDVGDVEEVDEQLYQMLNNLEGLREMEQELAAQIKKIKDEQLKPLASELSTLKKDQQDELKNAFLSMDSIQEDLENLDQVVFMQYKGKIAAFRRTLDEEGKPPTPADELNALRDILEQVNENHPKIVGAVYEALEQWKETVNRSAENVISIFPFRENRNPRKQSQLFTKVKNFFKGLWEKIKAIGNKLSGETYPKVAESIAALDQAEALLKTAHINQLSAKLVW